MKKYAAPLVSAIAVSIVIIAFGIFYFLIFKEIPGAEGIRFIFLAAAAISIVVMIAVLIQRFKEIKKGEEDDLGKY